MKAKKKIAIELELTEEEAQAILAVCENVRLTGPGKHLGGVVDALESADVDASEIGVDFEDGCVVLS